jgi:antitoxin component YwqK of YwqJK toxin-antitoxin module
MKPIFSFTLLLTFGIISCTSLKQNTDSEAPQDSFKFTKTSDSTCVLQVNNYDTVSFYESPYQKYMLNNSDKPDGKFIVCDENNRTRRTLYYKNHKREGKDTWFYNDGQIMQEKYFIHDRYVSYRLYYPKKHLIDTELKDTLGYKKRWDEEGHLIYEKNYVTGAFKQWYASGMIKSKGQECPGECFSLKGPWYYYNTAGSLTKIVFYAEAVDEQGWDSIYNYLGNRIVSIERK